MTSDQPAGTVSVLPPLRSDVQSVFHLIVVAGQRAKQLAAGARPRVEPGDHRNPRIALLEVMAGLVSWTVTEPPVAIAVKAPAGKL
jgi:DNA-directed RNA polymerase omega subunit